MLGKNSLWKKKKYEKEKHMLMWTESDFSGSICDLFWPLNIRTSFSHFGFFLFLQALCGHCLPFAGKAEMPVAFLPSPLFGSLAAGEQAHNPDFRDKCLRETGEAHPWDHSLLGQWLQKEHVTETAVVLLSVRPSRVPTCVLECLAVSPQSSQSVVWFLKVFFSMLPHI